MSPKPPTRLSARRGHAPSEALYDGVPSHLAYPLQGWAKAHLGNIGRRQSVADREAAAMRVGILCRVRGLVPEVSLGVLCHLAISSDHEETFLDVVDMHLQLYGTGVDELNTLLRDGGSAWVATGSPTRLERVVSDEEHNLYLATTSLADDAAGQLQEAWIKAYGRDPDPSDAWDHAIKAVEILLQPIAAPANDKATLGSMLAALEAKPEKWILTPASSSKQLGSVETLTAMLRLIWPNPDRHGSGSGSSRTPTREEAEQVVGLAVLVVSWLRKDALKPATPRLTAPPASP